MKWHKHFCATCDKTFGTARLAYFHRKDKGHETEVRYFKKYQRLTDVRGEKNGTHKLDNFDVRMIRLRQKSTYAYAKQYRVSQACIWAAMNKITWKHI